MSTIEQKHAYRFGYLKSEHWSNLRLEKLAESDARCEICGTRDISNDVHHLIYRKRLTETKLNELVVLCRDCHTRVHKVWDLPKCKNAKMFWSRWRNARHAVEVAKRAEQRIAKRIELGIVFTNSSKVRILKKRMREDGLPVDRYKYFRGFLELFDAPIEALRAIHFHISNIEPLFGEDVPLKLINMMASDLKGEFPEELPENLLKKLLATGVAPP